MRPNPYIVQTLKYATFTLLACGAIMLFAVVLRGTKAVPLTGRLVSQQGQGVIPIARYNSERAIGGFSAPADTHVFFTVPQGVRIPRITFLGGPDFDQKLYWGYCFSGNEAANKEKGLRGQAIYDGQFFYSIGERKSQIVDIKASDNDLVGILEDTTKTPKKAAASIAEIFYGGQTCYVMSSVILPVAVDTDGDDLNNERERELGTDPNNPDTDGDGIADGSEVFKVKTNPLYADTDQDGLSDTCEDKNKDGQVQKNETSPLLSDTDRDDLCDGNGTGIGCPEERTTICSVDADGSRNCNARPSSPVFGEDMDQNCETNNGETDPRNPQTFGPPDWDYKWSLLSTLNGNARRTDSAPSTNAPEFPIPNLPSN